VKWFCDTVLQEDGYGFARRWFRFCKMARFVKMGEMESEPFFWNGGLGAQNRGRARVGGGEGAGPVLVRVT